jgi:uncharacterized BrkB/YihY/UPF0761 family membrane protein
MLELQIYGSKISHATTNSFYFSIWFIALWLQMLVYEYMPNGTLRDHLSGTFFALIIWFVALSIFTY